MSAAAGLAACTAGGARNPRVTGPGADEADDTAALQRMLDQLSPGDTLVLPNATYRHRDVLVVRVPGTRIVGPGATLLATREDRSAFRIDADDVAVEGLVLAVESTTRRWDALAQHKVLLSGHRGIALRDVTVTGSAASGIFVDGAEDFLLERTTVTDTRADGIHLTAGAHDGRVVDAVTRGTGDDGIAVVSYEGTPPRAAASRSPHPRSAPTPTGEGCPWSAARTSASAMCWWRILPRPRCTSPWRVLPSTPSRPAPSPSRADASSGPTRTLPSTTVPC